MRTLTRQTSAHCGQAMVEFVLVLFLVMILVSGMLLFFRLLLFQFWAEQEARFIAWEYSYQTKGEELLSEMEPTVEMYEGGSWLVRPRVVTERTSEKSAETDGSVTDLLPTIFSSLWSPVPEVPLPEIVAPAYARLTKGGAEGGAERVKGEPAPHPLVPQVEERRQGFEGILAEFGPRFCSNARALLSSHKIQWKNSPLGSERCAGELTRALAETLATRLDFGAMFRDFGRGLENGLTPETALGAGVERAVAEGFYSFFDSTVKTAFLGSVPYIEAVRGEQSTAIGEESVDRIQSQLYYLGSTLAVQEIIDALAELVGTNAANRNPAIEREQESALNGVLHADASDVFPVGIDAFYLSPSYLPVPPTFGAAGGGLFDGIMLNVLSNESDGAKERAIEQSNILAEVSYSPEGGLFSGAVRRYATAGRALTARHYLVTQTWHQPRVNTDSGTYFEVGGEEDDYETATEEGMLRRRIMGMWLLPSDLEMLSRPLTALVGLEGLDQVFSLFSTFTGFIDEVKGWLTKNPLFDIMRAIRDLPGMKYVFPAPPVWPVARPEAYPGSEEMAGDQKMGGEREFEDYIEEQLEYKDREPNPTYHDD